jgi:hypothetical protein
MAAERDLELLDDYLANRLNANEKVSFERKLTTDPELQAEFNMQQALIGGIQKARVAELKAIMNNVPVSGLHSTGSVVATKVVLWVTVIGVVGVGSWFLMKDKEETPEVEKTQTESQQPVTDEKASEQTQPAEQDPSQPHEDSPVVSDEKASSEQKPADRPKPLKKKPAETPAEKIEVFDPTEESENEPPPLNFDNNPKLNSHSEIAVEVDSKNKKYNFHYQFKGGKLFLFGPFQKDLYEILEFFSDDTRTVFLYHDKQYYLLKDNNEKLKDLTAVQNEELVRKLNEYRKN